MGIVIEYVVLALGSIRPLFLSLSHQIPPPLEPPWTPLNSLKFTWRYVTFFASSMNYNNTQVYTNSIITGASTLVLVVPGFSVYTIVLIVMLQPCNKKYYGTSYYTIAKSLAFTDILTLSVKILLSLHLICSGQIFGQLLFTIIGWIFYMTWVVLIWHLVLMALNRCFKLCWTAKFDLIFQQRNVTVMLSLIYIFAGLLSFSYLIPGYELNYDFENFTVIPPNSLWHEIYTLVDYVATPLAFVIVTTSNVLVLRTIRSTRNSGIHTPWRHELHVFLQAGIISILCFLSNLMFYVVTFLTSNIWIVFVSSNVSFTANNILPPFVYLSCNRTLRAHVRLLIVKLNIRKRKIQPTSK